MPCDAETETEGGEDVGQNEGALRSHWAEAHEI